MDRAKQIVNIASIILSAGKSERMKLQKAMLPFSDEENFLEHIVRVYQNAGIKKITVVVNSLLEKNIKDEKFTGVTFVINSFIERGRVYSLKQGLSSCPDAVYCFVQNIDNPYVTSEVILKLLNSAASGDYITPVYKGKGGHPVLLSAKAIRYILNVKSDDLRLNEILEPFNRVRVEVDDENILTNINTQQDYGKYFSRTVNTY